MERSSGKSGYVASFICKMSHTTSHPTAIDRVHRIGQDKTVYVTHFIVSVAYISFSPSLTWVQVSNTIEKRILKIQKRKTAIVNEAFRGSGKTDPESIQNLKIMFGYDWDEQVP